MSYHSLEDVAFALEKKVAMTDVDLNKFTPMERIANALMKKYNVTLPDYLNDIEKIVIALDTPTAGPSITISTNGTYDVSDYTEAVITVYEDVQSITNAQIDALFA